MSRIKFPKYSMIVHRASCGKYLVIGTPDDGYRIEETNEPAYAYRQVETRKGELQGPIWVRSQAKTEDGRFVTTYPVMWNTQTEQGNLVMEDPTDPVCPECRQRGCNGECMGD